MGAYDDGDHHDEGAGEMVQHRPEEGAFYGESHRLHEERGKDRVERGHAHREGEEAPGGDLRRVDLAGAEEIDGDIHEDEQQHHTAPGLIEEGRGAVFCDIGDVAVDENDEDDADIARIGIGGHRLIDRAPRAVMPSRAAVPRERSHRTASRAIRAGRRKRLTSPACTAPCCRR